ncbi:MAG: SDR family oxidoreductase [bacterium]|nr:SDR family oxidoreductase [bacterium]
MDLMLQDKVALISGGSKGIGFYIAKDLADEGCHVIISGRTEADLRKAEAEINAQGKGKAASFCGDMTKPEAPAAFLKAGLDAFGGVDLLVNNVGGSDPKHLLDTDDDDWQIAFDFNLFHAVRLSRLAISEMKKRGGGSILNIASLAGRESGSAMTYNASKAALISFSKALSQQVAKDGIRVNTLAPGSVFFPGGVWERRMAAAPDNLEGMLKGMPLGRFGRPEEISSVAVFMLSPRASLVHGACYAVDGSQGRSNI